jgi:prepilin-type N-terminal cleavage/methylation domain-containing protein/prepilin-type processing-associated H-X9-DG protein
MPNDLIAMPHHCSTRTRRHLRSGALQRVSAFTLLELLVTIAVVVIIAAMLFAGIQTITQQTRATKCLNNMRQLGVAIQGWIGENQMKAPIVLQQPLERSWMRQIAPYLGLTGEEEEASIFRCPADPSENPKQKRTYRFNTSDSDWGENYIPFSFPTPFDRRSVMDVLHPSTYVMLFDVAYTGSYPLGLWQDSTNEWNNRCDKVQFPPDDPGPYIRPHYHNKAINLLFYDGHAAKHSYPLPDAFYYWDR